MFDVFEKVLKVSFLLHLQKIQVFHLRLEHKQSVMILEIEVVFHLHGLMTTDFGTHRPIFI